MINFIYFLEERNILFLYLKVVGRCDYFLYVRYFMIIFILSSGVWGNIVGKLVWIWVG